MTDKKFTDEEIIKALECCGSGYFEQMCPECPLYTDMNCNCFLAKFSLDLINRLKSENEGLISAQETWQKHIEKQKAEIEKLKSEVGWRKAEHKSACEALNEAIDARIKSIKEFVEIIVADYPKMEYYLENIEKEMVGDVGV